MTSATNISLPPNTSSVQSSTASFVLKNNQTIKKCILTFLLQRNNYKDIVNFALTCRGQPESVLGRRTDHTAILPTLVKISGSQALNSLTNNFFSAITTEMNQYFSETVPMDHSEMMSYMKNL